jgi:hypothetical protein
MNPTHTYRLPPHQTRIARTINDLGLIKINGIFLPIHTTRQKPHLLSTDNPRLDGKLGISPIPHGQSSIPLSFDVILIRPIGRIHAGPTNIQNDIFRRLPIALLVFDANDMTAESNIIHLTQNMPTGQSHQRRTFLQTNGTGAHDTEYFARVKIQMFFEVGKDVGAGVVGVVAGGAF